MLDICVRSVNSVNPMIGGPGGPWSVIGETADPTVVRQLTGATCGEACGATLLRGEGIDAFQSALAVRQGSALTGDVRTLASAMDELSGGSVWRGAQVDVLADPRGYFGFLGRNGSFMTSMYEPGMKLGHMVVVDGLDDVGRVLIRDPREATRYSMDWAEFTRVWEGRSIWRTVR